MEKAISPNHKYPHRFHEWNRAHRGAYKKGVTAFAAGVMLDECPYGDYRKGDGRLTWSRAFQAAWRDGWRDARKQSGPDSDKGDPRNPSFGVSPGTQ